ncbi:MAG: hypothetical protein K6G27_10330 [Lachnospiraceae bacterium]|nr:hypothetical protein [Lachnospiraceae bacterium]
MADNKIKDPLEWEEVTSNHFIHTVAVITWPSCHGYIVEISVRQAVHILACC